MARSSRIMRLVGTDSTGQSPDAASDDTMPSPELRPEVLAGLEHQQRRRAVEAALFGGSEAVSFGRYRLLHRLGEGGMGSVYAAYDQHLDRKIALKLIRTSWQGSAEVRERTRREARALARLSHPHVVHVYEVGEVDGQLFVAMEFLAGPTLRAWLEGHVRPWRDVLAAFREAGEGLAAAHAHGIVHRDFKPHNAMFGADGRVRVLDFGLARFGEVEETPWTDIPAPAGIPTPALTLTGTVLGTPAYMAPEQFSERRADARTDQFSFCVALHEALYGYRPFVGETLADLAAALAAGRVAARPRDTRVPTWVHSALLRGLQTDPARRWPSMQELLAALARTPGFRARRLMSAVALVAATGGATLALARANEVAVEQCPDARVELAGIWDEGRAATVREAVQSASPLADEVLARVEPRIVQYAGAWVDMRNEACHAHAEGRQSSHAFDLRTACLDQRRAGLDALVRSLETAESAHLHDVASAAAALPSLERCADTRALMAAIAPPEDERLSARVQLHRERLAQAQVHEHTGQYRRGLELVDAVLADTEALAHEPLLAEAYLRKGGLEMEYGDVQAALRSFDRALTTALAVDHAPVAAQASSKRGFIFGARMFRREQVEAELPLMAALNRRVQDDVDLYAEYLNNVGVIQHTTMGNLAEAGRLFEEAHALFVAHGRTGTRKAMAPLWNMALLAWDERRLEDAAELDRQIMSVAGKTLGPYSPPYLRAEIGLAWVSCFRGRLREAFSIYERLLAKLELVEDIHLRVMVLSGLVWATVEMEGDLRAARRYIDAAQSLPSLSDRDRVNIHCGLMRLGGAEGDATAVRASRDEALRLLGDPPSTSDRLYQSVILEHGLALEALNRPREAIVEFERLVDLREGEVAVARISELSTSLLHLGRLHRKVGEYELAQAELERALRELERIVPVRNFEYAEIFRELGELALDRQHLDDAAGHLSEAVYLFSTTAESDHLPLVRARFSLAQALTGAGPAPPEAPAHAEAALAALRARSKGEEARAVETWLAEHG